MQCQVHGEALASCLEYTVKLMAWLPGARCTSLLRPVPCLERASAMHWRQELLQPIFVSQAIFWSFGLRHKLGNTSELLFSGKTFLICDVSLDSPSHCLIVGGEGAAVQNCSSRLSIRGGHKGSHMLKGCCVRSQSEMSEDVILGWNQRHGAGRQSGYLLERPRDPEIGACLRYFISGVLRTVSSVLKHLFQGRGHETYGWWKTALPSQYS